MQCFDNITTLDEAAATRVRPADVTNPPMAGADDACSLIFLDAPYRTNIAARALTALGNAGWLGNGALVVVETERGADLALPEGLSETDHRAYGSTELHFLEYGDSGLG